MKHRIKAVVRSLGYQVSRVQPGGWPLDFRQEDIVLASRVQPFTMTSPERVKALADAVRYVVQRDTPGAIVECGVWRGGSMMAAALTLLELGAERDLLLYDTFESAMPAPMAIDRASRGSDQPYWNVATMTEVQFNMRSTGYPMGRVHVVKGRVEDTLPAQAPAEIAILRLDTDWYESTRHELTHLYPRLNQGGVLIVDDYGSHEGARLAVDEYFGNDARRPFLCRIDLGGVLGVKQG